MNGLVLSSRNTECIGDTFCQRKMIEDGLIRETQCRGIIIHRNLSWPSLHIIPVTPSQLLSSTLYGANPAATLLRCGAHLAIIHGSPQKVGFGSLIQG